MAGARPDRRASHAIFGGAIRQGARMDILQFEGYLAISNHSHLNRLVGKPRAGDPALAIRPPEGISCAPQGLACGGFFPSQWFRRIPISSGVRLCYVLAPARR